MSSERVQRGNSRQLGADESVTESSTFVSKAQSDEEEGVDRGNSDRKNATFSETPTVVSNSAKPRRRMEGTKKSEQNSKCTQMSVSNGEYDIGAEESSEEEESERDEENDIVSPLVTGFTQMLRTHGATPNSYKPLEATITRDSIKKVLRRASEGIRHEEFGYGDAEALFEWAMSARSGTELERPASPVTAGVLAAEQIAAGEFTKEEAIINTLMRGMVRRE